MLKCFLACFSPVFFNTLSKFKEIEPTFKAPTNVKLINPCNQEPIATTLSFVSNTFYNKKLFFC